MAIFPSSEYDNALLVNTFTRFTTSSLFVGKKQCRSSSGGSITSYYESLLTTTWSLYTSDAADE
jgi:hypothetical protein